jgi:hypothetical protein
MYLSSSTNPRVASISINATQLAATTNPRSFSALLFNGNLLTLSAVTNPRVASILLNQYLTVNASTNPRSFSANMYVGLALTLNSSTNPRSFSATLGQTAILLASTNPRTAFGILAGQIPDMALSASTNPRTAFIVLGMPGTTQFTVTVMNLKNKLVSFYENYNFESVAIFNGVPIGCDPATGLYVLNGPDDNGTEIDASILLGDYDFGIDNIKTTPRLYLNYSGDGEAQVSVSIDNDEMDGPYDIPAPHETKLQTRRAKLPIGFRGSHYQYLVENVQGSHLTIQNIELQFKKSQRRLH